MLSSIFHNLWSGGNLSGECQTKNTIWKIHHNGDMKSTRNKNLSLLIKPKILDRQQDWSYYTAIKTIILSSRVQCSQETSHSYPFSQQVAAIDNSCHNFYYVLCQMHHSPHLQKEDFFNPPKKVQEILFGTNVTSTCRLLPLPK